VQMITEQEHKVQEQCI